MSISPIPGPSSPPPPERRSRPDAAERILRAAARCIVASGAAAVTMHEVAEEAGVSKGLIHYHFHDKETLLARVVEWIASNLVARELTALAESSPRAAIDDLWNWVSSEIERGHIRVLLELAEWRSTLVQNAVRHAAAARREATTTSVDHLFTLLGLRPRIPPPLLADVVTAFVDGLIISATLHPDQNVRAAFDVFWLSMLGLSE